MVWPRCHKAGAPVGDASNTTAAHPPQVYGLHVCCRKAVLEPEWASGSLGELANPESWVPPPESDTGGLGQGLRAGTCNEFPGDAAAGLGLTL